MKIYIGSDHAGVDLKKLAVDHLTKMGFTVQDLGPFNHDSVDYPDYAHPVAERVQADGSSKGVLICGSGNGVAMTANKHEHIKAALCWTPEIAQLAREHNNANILVLPARFVSEALALQMIETFFTTDFEGGRHSKRVNKIDCR
jgi:ribose 5-phosphate isomerase B